MSIADVIALLSLCLYVLLVSATSWPDSNKITKNNRPQSSN